MAECVVVDAVLFLSAFLFLSNKMCILLLCCSTVMEVTLPIIFKVSTIIFSVYSLMYFCIFLVIVQVLSTFGYISLSNVCLT